MLKRLVSKSVLTASAGLALSCGVALGQANPLLPDEAPPQTAPAAPLTFVGEARGVPVVFQATTANGAFRGVLIVGAARFPCGGREKDGVYDGQWGEPDGRPYALHAVAKDGKLQLDTNGKSVTLTRQGQNPPPVTPPPVNPPVNPAPPTQPVADDPDVILDQVELVRGKSFTVLAPRGWKLTESEEEIKVASPDGRSTYGLITSAVDVGMTPRKFVAATLKKFDAADVRVVVTDEPPPESKLEEVVQIVTYKRPDGVKVTGYFKATAVKTRQGGRMIVLRHAGAPTEQFDGTFRIVTDCMRQIRVNEAPPPQPANPPRPVAP